MTSEPGSQPPRAVDADGGPGPRITCSDEPLRRLIALAARAVDMADASILVTAGPTTGRRISTAGYDEGRRRLVAGLDAAVASSGRPLAVPDLADRPSRRHRRARPQGPISVFPC